MRLSSPSPRHLARPWRSRRPLARLTGAAAISAVALAGSASVVTSLLPATASATPARTAAMARKAATPATDPWANNSPYYEVSTTGTVWPLAGATGYGSPNLAAWHTTPTDIAVTPDGHGYWILTPKGRIAQFGDARFYGSPFLRHHAIVAARIIPTADGHGYWVVGRGGSVQAFGDAVHVGGLGGHPVPAPIVDLVPTTDGLGYWLVGASGTVTAFGDATALTGTFTLDPGATVVGMAVQPGGAGAWLAASDGAVYPLGTAPALGGITNADQAITSIVPTSDGAGYWLFTHDGDIHPFGDAQGAYPPVTGFVHTVTGAGDQVVEWAMSQLGKPYQWGGTGPNAFDCSGLSMESWLSVGVNIPRVAAAQYLAGQKVTLANLVVGDLVYWATDTSRPSTIQHVALYLGGGQMVNAPYTGQVVSTSWIGGTGFLPRGTQPAGTGAQS